jgi:hypothetical protein
MNILQQISRIPPDKVLHFVGGTILAVFYVFVLYLFHRLQRHVSLPSIFLFSFVVGIIKELVYDKLLKKGTPDIVDALATGLGALPIMATVFLVQAA